MKNWNQKDVEILTSKGGVIALANPYDNLVTTGVEPWPPSEVVQKLYQSRQIRAFSEDQKNKIGYYYKLRMEGHHRLSIPLLPISFTLVGLAFLLGGDLNRRGQLFRILSAVSTVVVIEIAQLGAKNLGEKTQGVYLLMYFAPLIPALMGAWLLSPAGQLKKQYVHPVPDRG